MITIILALFIVKLFTEAAWNIKEQQKITYKSEARASPPGLSIRIITALYLFDSREKKRIERERERERERDEKTTVVLGQRCK